MNDMTASCSCGSVELKRSALLLHALSATATIARKVPVKLKRYRMHLPFRTRWRDRILAGHVYATLPFTTPGTLEQRKARWSEGAVQAERDLGDPRSSAAGGAHARSKRPSPSGSSFLVAARKTSCFQVECELLHISPPRVRTPPDQHCPFWIGGPGSTSICERLRAWIQEV